MATSAVYLVKKPPDIVEVSDRFTQFHRNRFNSRRLAFWVDKGNAEVSVQSNAKTEKILVVSTCQMLVLLLFNQRTPWTFKDILKATRIPRKDLAVAVLSMTHLKVKVMRKALNTKELHDDDKFQANPNYSNER